MESLNNTKKKTQHLMQTTLYTTKINLNLFQKICCSDYSLEIIMNLFGERGCGDTFFEFGCQFGTFLLAF